MTKTIKELADELGFSKTYITQTINKNSLQSSLRKTGNKFVIDEALESVIKSILIDKSEIKNENSSQSFSQTANTEYLKEIIEELRKQLAIKDDQIAKKDKQLDQQQQLTLAAIKTQEQLQIEKVEKDKQIETLNILLSEVGKEEEKNRAVKQHDKYSTAYNSGKWWKFWK